MAARRRCSPWPGRSGAVERARGTVEASSSCYEPNALKIKRNEEETRRFRRGEALRRGRANSGERFRVHGGLSPRLSVRRGLPRRRRTRRWSRCGERATNATCGERRSAGRQWRRSGATAARASGEEEREREGTEWRLGARGAVPTGVSRSASGASTTPAYGRHVAGVRWSKAGAHVRERGGETGPGRKGGGRRSSACPLFFEFLFSKNLK